MKEKLKNVDSEILVYEPGHKTVSVPRDAKLFSDKEVVSKGSGDRFEVNP